MQTVNLGELRSTLKTSTVLTQTDWKVLAAFGAWCLSWAHLSQPLLKIPAGVCSCLAGQTGFTSPRLLMPPTALSPPEKQIFNLSAKITQSTHNQKSQQWNKIGPSIYTKSLHHWGTPKPKQKQLFSVPVTSFFLPSYCGKTLNMRSTLLKHVSAQYSIVN